MPMFYSGRELHCCDLGEWKHDGEVVTAEQALQNAQALTEREMKKGGYIK